MRLTELTGNKQYREAIDGYKRLEAQPGTPGWLKAACEDADRRALPEVKPLLEGLARSTTALREADRARRGVDWRSGTTAGGDADKTGVKPADTTE